MILRAGVKALAQPRHPEGMVKYREDAVTNEDLWHYAGRQEDVEELSNLDKAKIIEFVDFSTSAMEKARLPACPWYKWFGRVKDGKLVCN